MDPSMQRETSVPTWSRLAAVAAVVSAWLLVRPYGGIRHDARLYFAQALFGDDPAFLANDLLIANDQQMQFSIYGQLIDLGLHWLEPGTVALILTAVGLVAWILAASLLGRTLTRRWWWIIALIIPLAGASYGPHGIFLFAEGYATPRGIAEALAVAAIAFALREKIWLAVGLAALGGLVHPLVAVSGLIAVVCIAAVRGSSLASSSSRSRSRSRFSQFGSDPLQIGGATRLRCCLALHYRRSFTPNLPADVGQPRVGAGRDRTDSLVGDGHPHRQRSPANALHRNRHGCRDRDRCHRHSRGWTRGSVRDPIAALASCLARSTRRWGRTRYRYRGSRGDPLRPSNDPGSPGPPGRFRYPSCSTASVSLCAVVVIGAVLVGGHRIRNERIERAAITGLLSLLATVAIMQVVDLLRSSDGATFPRPHFLAVLPSLVPGIPIVAGVLLIALVLVAQHRTLGAGAAAVVLATIVVAAGWAWDARSGWIRFVEGSDQPSSDERVPRSPVLVEDSSFGFYTIFGQPVYFRAELGAGVVFSRDLAIQYDLRRRNAAIVQFDGSQQRIFDHESSIDPTERTGQDIKELCRLPDAPDALLLRVAATGLARSSCGSRQPHSTLRSNPHRPRMWPPGCSSDTTAGILGEQSLQRLSFGADIDVSRFQWSDPYDRARRRHRRRTSGTHRGRPPHPRRHQGHGT